MNYVDNIIKAHCLFCLSEMLDSFINFDSPLDLDLFYVFFSGISYTAIIIGTFICFLLDYFWYSSLIFGGVWLDAINKTVKDIEGKSPFKGFVVTAILHLCSSLLISGIGFLSNGSINLFIFLCVLLGLILISRMLLPTVFEGRSIKLWFINASYQIICLFIIAISNGLFIFNK